MKTTTNIFIIITLLLILGSGVFMYFYTKKIHDQEKQQECARNAKNYIDKENKRSSDNFTTWRVLLDDTNYYDGFCYALLSTVDLNGQNSDAIMNVDSGELITIKKGNDSFNSSFFENKNKIFKK